ncbi:MAG: LamG domain-containing protein [Methanoregula sp.]
MVLIIVLVIGLALAVYGMIFGSISLNKVSMVAASAGTFFVPLDTSSSMQIMRVTPAIGEDFYIQGQGTVPKNAASTQIAVVSFILRNPQGEIYTVTNGYITGNANKYGTNLYIYKDSSNAFKVTDTLDSISYAPTAIRPFELGDYQITMIDTVAKLPMNIMDVKITGNETSSTGSQASLPLLNVLPNSTWTAHGGVTNTTDPVTGLTMYTFDGSSGYLTSTANPALDFTGDLTLSLWMKPTTTGDSSSSSNWHAIIGKGELIGTNNENDNYQLMQLGDKLLFEWNDATTGEHYQAITENGVLTAGTLQYVTTTVTGGALTIQVNGGSPVALTYNTGNVPGAGDDLTDTPPTVVLANNAHDLMTGKQNAPEDQPQNQFHYSGDMSEVALYNRALTAGEIAHNLNYYKI